MFTSAVKLTWESIGIKAFNPICSFCISVLGGICHLLKNSNINLTTVNGLVLI